MSIISHLLESFILKSISYRILCAACLRENRHYRKSIGALIVYDITKEQSFMSVKKWIEEVREHAEPEIVIMLVGNKLDLAE